MAFDKILRDVRYSLRLLRKNLGLNAMIVLSIGLGIGLNTTIFSLFSAIILRPLPGAQAPRRLMELYTSYSGGMRFGAVSYPDYKDWRDRNEEFSGLLAQSLVPANLNRGDRNEVISGAIVSSNYFSVLGVKPAVGQFFISGPDDDQPNSQPVAVISSGLWQREFGADPSIVGRLIMVNAHGFTVLGVASADFKGANVGLSVDIWAPMAMQPVLIPGADRLQARGTHWLDVIGRLKPGFAPDLAQQKLTSVSSQLAQEFPDTNRGTGITIVQLGHGPAGLQSMLIPVISMLMVVVLLIMLMACFNVENLLLSRGSSREGEVAVRLALGAPRKDLLRLMLTESVLLALFAGGFALILSYESISLLERFKPPTSVPLFLGLELDNRVCFFTLLLSVGSGILIGIVPAVRNTAPHLLSMLRNEGFFRIYRKSKLQNALVVGQIAISLFLLIGAGLILRSLQNVQTIDPGFKADNLLLASLDVGLAGYDRVRGTELYRQVVQRVENLPGVRSASLAQAVPMEIEATQQIGIYVEGYESPNHWAISMDYNIVSPGYFNTLGIPLVQGRDFTEQDKADCPPVAIINEAFARRYWPGEDPLGKKITIGSQQGPYVQIVGVAKNSKYYSMMEDAFPFMYLPLLQMYQQGMVLYVRTAGDPALSLSAIEREVQSLDGSLPIFRVRTMKEHLGLSLIELRGAALLLGVFGVLALILAAIGLYGLMAYSIENRKSEIAIRMAVGAQNSQVLNLILKEGMVLAGVGIALGLGGAFAVGRMFAFFLYGVSPADPLAISISAGFLIAVALLASFLPAWKASRTEPAQVLRSS